MSVTRAVDPPTLSRRNIDYGYVPRLISVAAWQQSPDKDKANFKSTAIFSRTLSYINSQTSVSNWNNPSRFTSRPAGYLFLNVIQFADWASGEQWSERWPLSIIQSGVSQLERSASHSSRARLPGESRWFLLHRNFTNPVQYHLPRIASANKTHQQKLIATDLLSSCIHLRWCI